MHIRSFAFAGLVVVLTACGPAPSSETPPPVAPPPQAPLATAPAAPAGKAPTAPVALEEYFKVRRVGGASFSHDEKMVAYMSDEGGRMDVWAQPVGGGKAVQLTKVSGFVQSFAFSPTADVLLYESDAGGNELPHIYLTDSKGSPPKDVTAEYPPDRRTDFVSWAEDGKTFLYLSNLRDPQYLDLYEYSLDKKKGELLWESSGKIAFGIASRDHKRFVVLETITDADSNLYLVERGKKGEKVLLTPHQGEVLHEPSTFSRDGRTVFYTADAGREFRGAYALDLAGAKDNKLAPKAALEEQWDVDEVRFSKSWKYFVTNTNVDGTPKVVVRDAATKAEVKLPAPDGAGALVPTTFSRSDRFVGAAMVSDDAPTAVWVLDLKDNKATKLTEVMPDSLKSRKMVSGASILATSFDGRKVPAYVYKPEGPGPFPAVIDVHGGPTAQSKRRFDPLRQYLVSKGYVVMVPNVRGSTGYGKTYTKLDNMDLGGGPLKDVVACKKWLVENAKVAPDKVVVLGGSYGGYMALAASTFTPTEFAASVDYFGVSDLKSLVESFPPYWMAFATFIYNKFGDPKNPAHAQYQRDRSPLHHVDKIQRPLLVVQGANDARVKKDQSDRIVAALEKRKVPVHYLVIAGEGHGFSKNDNRLLAYKTTDRFLDRYIWNDPTVQVTDAPK
jgi:dipeptidyl aminopeptidase/acylaminoacyl peptidase